MRPLYRVNIAVRNLSRFTALEQVSRQIFIVISKIVLHLSLKRLLAAKEALETPSGGLHLLEVLVFASARDRPNKSASITDRKMR